MMSMDISKIRSAKDSMDKIEELKENVRVALSPVLTDTALISKVYGLYKEYVANRGEELDVVHRKRFLFIAVYLFCPSVLIGGKMSMGLRAILCNVMRINSASTISNEVVSLLFLYGCYQDFREGVNDAFAYIASEMGLKDF